MKTANLERLAQIADSKLRAIQKDVGLARRIVANLRDGIQDNLDEEVHRNGHGHKEQAEDPPHVPA